MPESLTPLAAVAALALLATVVVLVAIALSRLSALAAARDAAARAVADLRTRLEVLAAQNADFERDLRQDLAIARQRAGGRRAGGAQRARRPTLAQHGAGDDRSSSPA